MSSSLPTLHTTFLSLPFALAYISMRQVYYCCISLSLPAWAPTSVSLSPSFCKPQISTETRTETVGRRKSQSSGRRRRRRRKALRPSDVRPPVVILLPVPTTCEERERERERAQQPPTKKERGARTHFADGTVERGGKSLPPSAPLTRRGRGTTSALDRRRCCVSSSKVGGGEKGGWEIAEEEGGLRASSSHP